MLVLTLNSGSSSLKCAVVDPTSGETLRNYLVENLGTERARMVAHAREDKRLLDLMGSDHARALRVVFDELRAEHEIWSNLCGVGHRVVHGGEAFTKSVLIDDAVERVIRDCETLAPLHNPANLLGIRVARQTLPELTHVAVFDTAFHQTMPEHAYRYAIPEPWYRDYGVRRYGFHGTSHRYVAGEAVFCLGRPAEDLNLITAHLGNGCSTAAILGGRCVDTSMGFTPLEGLVMGTRSGDLDPAIIFHLSGRRSIALAAIDRALNHESGLLGLSGLSNDMRTLTEQMDHHEGARLAVEVFCHRLAKSIGALRTSFDRLDAIVFTGGIGEHSALVRGLTLKRLAGLGLLLDEGRNARSERRIDAEGSASALLVIPTNEELMIARDTSAIALGVSARNGE